MTISEAALADITRALSDVRSLTRQGSDLPVAAPDLEACLVRAVGMPGGVDDGLYLLVVAEGDPHDLDALSDRLPRRGVYSPFGSSLPLAVANTGTALPTGVAFLCQVPLAPARAQIAPLAPRLSDRRESVPSLQALVGALADQIAGWNAPGDFARPNHAVTSSPFAWLRSLTPLSRATTVECKLEFAGRILLNPAAFAMRPILWANTPPLTLPVGTVLGRAGVEHVFSAGAPFWIDARAVERDMPVWLDWATLELSALLRFMGFPMAEEGDTDAASVERWWGWEQVCLAACGTLVPADLPAGRDSYLALLLISQLRERLQAYIGQLPPTLQEHVKTGFWLTAVASALRLSADPRLPPLTRKAALGYAASAFGPVGEYLGLACPDSTTLPLSAYSLPPVVRMAELAVADVPAFAPGCGLIIGTGHNSADPALSLPATAADAQAIGRLLTVESGYAPEKVRVVTDQAANCDGILAGLEYLRNITDADSVVLIYFSGHGGLVDGRYYLIPSDVASATPTEKAILMTDFIDRVTRIPARQTVVFLDCCHAGGASMAGMREALPFVPKSADPAAWSGVLESRALITSSSAAQHSYILGGHEHSLFTEVLLECWRGMPEVEVARLFPAVRDDVIRRARASGYEQHPRFSGHLGQIVLAAK